MTVISSLNVRVMEYYTYSMYFEYFKYNFPTGPVSVGLIVLVPVLVLLRTETYVFRSRAWYSTVLLTTRIHLSLYTTVRITRVFQIKLST